MQTRDLHLSNEDAVQSAQRVANYAASLGVMEASLSKRLSYRHIGALMADSILQSGLNYKTVVYPRVKRILAKFPEANTLTKVNEVIVANSLKDFLMWTHPTKLERFLRLAQYLSQNGIETTNSLRDRMVDTDFKIGLLSIHGIGPKTVDYISCLAGVETVAVDRHILTFAREANIDSYDYENVCMIFSYAADLLDISRCGFDSWIWNIVSSR